MSNGGDFKSGDTGIGGSCYGISEQTHRGVWVRRCKEGGGGFLNLGKVVRVG